MKLTHLFLVIMLLAGTLLPGEPAYADTLSGEPLYVAETGHTLGYGFRKFFEERGGLTLFGLPLTEVFLEDGKPVQYFERARLEWHATSATVQAGHLGRWAAQQYSLSPAFAPVAAAPPDAIYFQQTGHTLRGMFLRFWRTYGGVVNFGYPLSEEFSQQGQQGQTLLVQYFERARFELHPDGQGGFQVQLGHLGREYLAVHPLPDWAIQPVSSADQAWQAVRPTHISVPRIGIDAGITMTGFSYGAWEVPLDAIAHYWPVSAMPNTAGNIVLAGHVGYSDILFNYLPNIVPGDEILVTAGGVNRRYITQEVLTLLPNETWVMNPTTTETLTLITCVPIGVYSHRLVVRAFPAPEQ